MSVPTRATAKNEGSSRSSSSPMAASSCNSQGASHSSRPKGGKNQRSGLQAGTAGQSWRTATLTASVVATTNSGIASAGPKRRISHPSASTSSRPAASSGRHGCSSSAPMPSADSGVPAMMLRAPLAISQPVEARKPAITWNGMKRTSRAAPKRTISR